MLQQDSIYQETVLADGDTAVAQHRPLTPAQVLSWLPGNATPAQQDSAIQAHFKPAEIRWSERPDTLHLPGHDAGVDLMRSELPQYYKEGFFSKDTLFHPELKGGRYGVAGDPVPYSVQGDDLITTLLLACFLLAVVSFSNAKHFIVRQFKDFYYHSHGNTTEVTETSSELRFQLFLVFLACLQVSLLTYFYTTYYIADTFVLQSEYHLIAIFLGLAIGYTVLRGLLYTGANMVFFDGKKNRQWMKSLLFITSMEGVLFFPGVMLRAYFQLPMENIVYYVAFVVILTKIVTIYKCYTIFFRQTVFHLHIFLYFCTLEMIPMLLLWRAVVMIGNELKINY